LKNYYDMLSVPREAPADEIKKAFRREIARYHPDKVQHLGPEFQEMAAGIAADLTEAYRILMDPALRAKYDGDLGGAAPDARPSAPQPSAGPSAPTPFGQGAAAPPPPPPPRPTAGFDFVKRASLSKMSDAIGDVLAGAEAMSAPGFDLAIVTRPKKGLFRKAEESACLLVKLVPFVDAAAVAAIWGPATKAQAGDAARCAVLLMGQGMAPARDLAAAVSEQRRKSRGAGPLLIPVDVRDWEALFPPETPGAVRSLLQRLKDEKR
jgi:hypothetical protein